MTLEEYMYVEAQHLLTYLISMPCNTLLVKCCLEQDRKLVCGLTNANRSIAESWNISIVESTIPF